MDAIGAFLAGKLMAVFPNEKKYYEELYLYAIEMCRENEIFLEIRCFDTDVINKNHSISN